MMNKSESIAALAKALAVAQGELENANKNSSNLHFKSKYADLAEILNTVRPVFSKHGLAIVQMPSFEGGLASVETLLTYTNGEWISSVCSAPVQKSDPQGVGSAITYLRRYSLAAFAGIAQEDDDANGASRPDQAAPPRQAVTVRQAKPTLDDTRFGNAIHALRNGTTTSYILRDKYALTNDQLQQIAEVEGV